MTSSLYHYLTCALTIVLPALGVSLSQGITSLAAIDAINIQPKAQGEINRTFILSMALIETSGILSFILGLKLALMGLHTESISLSFVHWAELGIVGALGITGCFSGIASCLPAREACLAVARQPFFTNKIQLLMLITQSLMQTPIILGLIIAMFIQIQLETVTTFTDSLRLIASGLSIGLGSIGPLLGISFLAKEACKAIGINKNVYSKILTFTVISAALIESAIIFSLLVSFVLLKPQPETFYKGYILIAASIAMGCGTFGVGISSGRLTAQVCQIIPLKPDLYPELSKSSLFSQILIETSAIYALLIALSLIVF